MRFFFKAILLLESTLVGVVALVGMASVQASARISLSKDVDARCKSIETEDFSALSDAPAQVIETRIIEENGAVPGYCQVTGYVAPTVKFVLRMPHGQWNGKLLQLGCGAHCGSTDHVRRCAGPLGRGYACVVTDDGHQALGSQALWAYNNWQAQIDYFVRAAHVTSLAAKAIIQSYYRSPPKRAYFMGCSAGGREAMMEAQRFPWDFDGIIAGAPSLSQTSIRMNLLWGNRALKRTTGEPLLNPAEFALLHASVVERCDLNDGVKDGLIGDPRTCDFDPSELLCNAKRTKDCLTEQQVEGVRKLYAGPVTRTGQKIDLAGALRGSELTWHDWFGVDEQSAIPDFVQEAFRYYAFHPNPGAAWNIAEFDFERDYKRLGLADGLYAAVNPDLRKFKAAGGKLLMYTGWNDAAGMPLPVIDYYEMAEKILGGRASTQDFLRLFVIPGMNHCTGGDGASVVDYLTYLEAWVEKDQPPAELMSFHIALHRAGVGAEPIAEPIEFPLDPRTIKFSRPVYPYPTHTQYLGHGDPSDARNFGPVEP